MPQVDHPNRASAILGTIVFLLVAPGVVAGLIPWWIDHWQLHSHPPGLGLLRAAGLLLIAAGLAVLLDAFARFALQGFGTPAPIYPTQLLIISGPYRFVRNPMYVAVTSMVIGQALLFADPRILAYAILAWTITHLFVLFYEEPTMRRSFPDDFATYSANVPRWIPRLNPWNGGRGNP